MECCRLSDNTLLPGLLYHSQALSADELNTFLEQIDSPQNVGYWTDLRRRRVMQLGGVPLREGMRPVPIPDWAWGLRNSLHRHSVISSSSEGISGALCPEPNHVLINEYLRPNGIMAHEDGPLYFPVVAIFSLLSPVVLRFQRKMPKWNCVERKRVEDASSIYDDEPDDEIAKMIGVSQNSVKQLPSSLSLLLEPQSLVVFQGEFYTDWQHGISDTSADVIPPHELVNGPLLSAELATQWRTALTTGEALTIPRGERRISVTYRYVPNVISS